MTIATATTLRIAKSYKCRKYQRLPLTLSKPTSITAQANMNGANKMHDSITTKDMGINPVNSATAETAADSP